jgi:hypothetical protein
VLFVSIVEDIMNITKIPTSQPFANIVECYFNEDRINMTQSVKVFESDPHLFLCAECNGPIITDDYRGETLCEACGLIHSEKACDTANFGKTMYSAQEINRRSHYGDPQSIFTPGICYSTFIESKKLFDPKFKRITFSDKGF